MTMAALVCLNEGARAGYSCSSGATVAYSKEANL